MKWKSGKSMSPFNDELWILVPECVLGYVFTSFAFHHCRQNMHKAIVFIKLYCLCKNTYILFGNEMQDIYCSQDMDSSGKSGQIGGQVIQMNNSSRSD